MKEGAPKGPLPSSPKDGIYHVEGRNNGPKRPDLIAPDGQKEEHMMRIKEAEEEIRSFFEQTNLGPQYIAAFGPDLKSVAVYNRHNNIVVETGRLVGGEWEMVLAAGGDSIPPDSIKFRRQGGNLIFEF